MILIWFYNMENSVDSVTVHSNSPDREFGTKGNSIIQILCNYGDIETNTALLKLFLLFLLSPFKLTNLLLPVIKKIRL